MQADSTLLCVPQQGIHLHPRLNTADAQMISAYIILQCHFQIIEHTKPPATHQTHTNLLWVQNASRKQDERIHDTISCCIYIFYIHGAAMRYFLVPHCCTMRALPANVCGKSKGIISEIAWKYSISQPLCNFPKPQKYC